MVADDNIVKHTWEGMVCTSCDSGFESSPTNAVEVRDFEFCPVCGGSRLEYKTITKPIGVPINEYLSGV